MKPTSNKHLNIYERVSIQDMLDAGFSFTAIANAIGKHRTTISREVKQHRIKKHPVSYSIRRVPCLHRKSCADAGIFCRPFYCARFQEETCPNLKVAPFVCNACETKAYCRFEKFFYSAPKAQSEYEFSLSDCRSGLYISQECVDTVNKVIVPLIKDKKQSVSQVYINHKDMLPFSKSTFYKYVNEGVFNLKNIDLPRKVRYRISKKSKCHQQRKNLHVLKGRTYLDYQRYVAANPYASVVQMDTVVGTKGSKCFLTLMFLSSRLMLIIPMPYQRSECVVKQFKLLKEVLGYDTFHKLFEVILTDNGSEFSDPIPIEADLATGQLRSHVFYCDPYSSWQKGALEKNHEYIRYVLPKGKSFSAMDESKCSLLANHINSIPRQSLNGHTPYELAEIFMPEDALAKLNVKKINADEVSLSSALVK